ncbi:MAG: alpha/beta hydrolase [Bacillota bacterium]|nr:alpha/beta hydrolase [Bacillota bacterium]
MKKKLKNILIIVCIVLSLFVVYYVNDYYHAQNIIHETTSIQSVHTEDYVVYEPENADIGFILYPGAKVEFIAYEPLIEQLAQERILSCVVRMPLNFAILDEEIAEEIIEMYPNIKEWYIGGHSLGGVAAASFASKNKDLLQGIIFLASYSTKDLSETKLKGLSIYGSEDGVLNQDSYKKNKRNFPKKTKEYCIQGGNHAYYGNYGEQDGDGIATISRKHQQEETVKSIIECIRSLN